MRHLASLGAGDRGLGPPGAFDAAARMAGINVAGHKMLVYAMAGGLYGLAAIVQTSRALTAQTVR